MTPYEAFQVAQRYKLAKFLGLQPKPLRAAPRMNGDLYLPGYFLWMCFGRRYSELTFEKMLVKNKRVSRKGAANGDRVYNVGSVRRLLQRRHITRGRKQKNRAARLHNVTVSAE